MTAEQTAPGLETTVAAARATLLSTAQRLSTAGARDEALARYEEPKPVLGVLQRAPRMRALGRAWRLGALLLQADGSVWATGISTRVTEPGRPQHHSASVEIRRAYRAAALQGGFALGETVNHNVTPIALDETLAHATGPLFVRDQQTWVRWGTDAPVELSRYLSDLASLLLDPPQGA